MRRIEDDDRRYDEEDDRRYVSQKKELGWMDGWMDEDDGRGSDPQVEMRVE